MTPGRAGCRLAGFSAAGARQGVGGGGKEPGSSLGPASRPHLSWASPGRALRPGHDSDTVLAREPIMTSAERSPGSLPEGLAFPYPALRKNALPVP